LAMCVICVATPTMTTLNVLLTSRSWRGKGAAGGTSERAEGWSLAIHDFLTSSLAGGEKTSLILAVIN
jgi:hypothetical protein